LLFFWITMAGRSVVPEEELAGLSTAFVAGYQIARGAIPLSFLVLSIILALRDRARIVCVVSSLLLLSNLAVVAHVLSGSSARLALESPRASRLYAELAQARDPRLTDAQRESYEERAMVTLEGMLASENEVESGSAAVLLSMIETLVTRGEHFEHAVEAMDDPRYFDVPQMVRSDDFKWQLETTRRYAAAARETFEGLASFPDDVIAAAMRRGLDAEQVPPARDFVEKAGRRVCALYRAHIELAGAYGACLEFLAEHRHVLHACDAEGEWCIKDDDVFETSERLWADMEAAESRLGAAIDSVQQLRFDA
jgi:hypothetical protein